MKPLFNSVGYITVDGIMPSISPTKKTLPHTTIKSLTCAWFLAAVMALAFAAKKTQVFMPLYSWIATTVKSKRAVVALISTLSGVIPISGRVAVSAGALDTIAPEDQKKT